jgi:non-ribosomal peptide synthase protein (TIGR01720 family)
LEDLLLGYEQLDKGHGIELPPKTTSFQQWSQKLSAYGRSDAALKEKEYWLQVCRAQKSRLPVDTPGGVNTLGTCARVNVSLTAPETQSLLQEVLGVYHTQINDLLLTALLKSFAPWTGRKDLMIALEGHGREALFEDADVSRTVGWFTSIYPVHLELPESTVIAEELKSVKEQLRRVPNAGIGFEILRFLSEDAEITREFETQQRPEVTFNYLGQFDQLLAANMPVSIAQESSGSSQSLRAARTQLLDVIAAVTGGQLHVNLFYCENLHRRTTIEALANQFIAELRALLVHCKSPDAGGYTPSDFPDASLSQRDLDDLFEELDESIR